MTVTHHGQGRFTAWMQQPRPTVSAYDRPEELLEVLGLPPSRLPVLTYDAGIAHVYITAPSVEAVTALRPDFAALRAIVGRHRINVFAPEGPGRVTTRMFSTFDTALPEDPARGSAAGSLTAHLVRHGLHDSGAELTLSQGESGQRQPLLPSASAFVSTMVAVPHHPSHALIDRWVLKAPHSRDSYGCS
ncbi:PhzF family phenazine biosynthesis protein [Streptomyces albipurpureus]|uniref:PhzF family phenazine biosynthesis protein n=1 Tax=Streptomyces albipurpureus TaxID=2897419 RepID=A0ABT0UFK5_9ACTN|nr:PhzF family phenazine biosynthesis protein [Streptomyces sp. CWNU-1]MCM2387394.1 PhzF family phenazine biosynthesis protein [Streptomyces sp. CWNU-1]